MQITTKNFGEITFEENEIITFLNPLSGLGSSTKYLLIKQDEDELFFWLQSVDQPNVSICLLDVFKVMPEYNPEVSENQVMALGEFSPENPLGFTMDDIKTLNVLVIPTDIKEMTVNLLAPIVINTNTKKAGQLIAQNENEISFKIFEKLNLDSTNGGNV